MNLSAIESAPKDEKINDVLNFLDQIQEENSKSKQNLDDEKKVEDALNFLEKVENGETDLSTTSDNEIKSDSVD